MLFLFTEGIIDSDFPYSDTFLTFAIAAYHPKIGYLIL